MTQYQIIAPTLPRQVGGDYLRSLELMGAEKMKSISEAGLYLVTNRSPMPIRRGLRRMATYFRREFGYDFVQYSEREDNDPKETLGFLFTDGFGGYDERVIGGSMFRWREYKDSPPGWALQWIWLHPYERGKGKLKDALPAFKLLFGDNFFVEGPRSAAMKAFLEKHYPNGLPHA